MTPEQFKKEIDDIYNSYSKKIVSLAVGVATLRGRIRLQELKRQILLKSKETR